MGRPAIKLTQRTNPRNDHRHHGIPKRPHTVPPMLVHLPSRHISVEKHAALNNMIDDLLDVEAIQPSRATARSQVHLARKPSNG